MNNKANASILEISQWLHEKGFECDMWFDHDKYAGALFVCPDYVKAEIDNPSSANLAPYFTINRALELLPPYIADKEGKMYWLKHLIEGTRKYFKSHEFCYRSVGSTSNFLTSKEHKDSHLAALRLLKKTVEGGYLQ